jgi:hypothetical protein
MKNNFKIILITAAVLSMACTTRVSEWFLLNATPEKYLLVYYHKDPVSEPVIRNHAELEQRSKPANLVLKPVVKENIDKPYYALYYNNRLFSEYADYNEIKGIFNSPLRERIAAELLSGKLCTMLYLKSGNKDKDEAGLDIVKNAMAASQFGNIVSVIELDRGNEEEKHLVSMLLNIEHDLKDIHEPMLFGIFGRFRVLEPLLAKGISEENINLLLGFLTADCSCLIKDNLPGINMLCTDDWDEPKPALVNNILDNIEQSDQ